MRGVAVKPFPPKITVHICANRSNEINQKSLKGLLLSIYNRLSLTLVEAW